MKMKFFGKYLIDKQLITEAQLLDALIEQLRPLPNLAVVAYDQKLLDSETLMRILEVQLEQSKDFPSAAQELGVWNEAFSDKIDDALKPLKVPLGHILAKNGVASLEALTQALNEYLAHENEIAQANQARAKTGVDFDWTFRFNDLIRMDSSLVFLYLEFWNEALRSQLDDALAQWRGNAQQSACLDSLSAEIHRLRGVSRYVCARLSEQICAIAEHVLARVTAHFEGLSAEHVEKTCHLLEISFELLWSARQSIEYSNSEASLVNDSEFVKHVREVQILASELVNALNAESKAA